MFKKAYYKNKTKEEILQDVKNEGFNPLLISDPPGRVYAKHQHKETKLLVCLEGSMEITVEDENTYQFEPGDKLIIPGNIPHKAIVGKNGCKFYWSEEVL